MRRIYHDYRKWEEFKFGMWRKETPEYEAEKINEIVMFIGDHKEYGKAMIEMLNNWPVSCEDKISNVSINRKAWVGHAACCFKNNYPEYLVRKAWRQLTDNQRNKANKEAENTIRIWEQNQILKSILNRGNKDVISLEYQMKLQLNWNI